MNDRSSDFWARAVTAAVLSVALAATGVGIATPDARAEAATMVTDGAIVLFRHATAPGVGDPAGFRLGDCSTQRNLDDAGREEARRLGQALANRNVKVTEVWTSQWCRTRDTAALAFPGVRAQDVSVFNSFFGQGDRDAEQTRSARILLLQWRGPGVLAVTTHQVNITALTEQSTSAGEGIVVRAVDGRLQVVGRLPAPR